MLQRKQFPYPLPPPCSAGDGIEMALFSIAVSFLGFEAVRISVKRPFYLTGVWEPRLRLERIKR
jgi:hypothetical protein